MSEESEGVAIWRASAAEIDTAFGLVGEYYERANVVARESREEFAKEYFAAGRGFWLARGDGELAGGIGLRKIIQPASSPAAYGAIVKTQLAIFRAVFEVDIRRLQMCIAGHLSERQIVSSDESDCTLRDQTSGKGLGSDAAIVGICAAEQFVQQK